MITRRRRLAPICSKVAAVGVLLFSLATQYGRADSVLVGTDLSGLQEQGGVLCPRASGCSIRAQEFTLFIPVQVSAIQVLVSGPFGQGGAVANFTTSIEMTLASQFPARFGTTFWDDTATFSVAGSNYPKTELLTFSGLNLFLGAGTYYLEAQGGDVGWGAISTPLATTAGTLGLNLACDPYENCTPDRVDSMGPGYYGAFDLVGTTSSTPEPSTWVLSGTGLLSLGLLGWSKASRVGV